jgi:hypothetical protein
MTSIIFGVFRQSLKFADAASLVLLAVILLLGAAPVVAEEVISSIAQGGRLYDKVTRKKYPP